MDAKVLQLVSFLLITLYGVSNVKVASAARIIWSYTSDYSSNWFYDTCEETCTGSEATTSVAVVNILRSTASFSYTPYTTVVLSGRKKRSAPAVMVDESGRNYMNGTVEDVIGMFNTFDGNCDGYIDVTEWSKLSHLDQFTTLLNSSDANGDSRISLMELKSRPLRIYPASMNPENQFMMMPMGMYEEMKSIMENNQEEEGKERKDTE